MVGTPSLVNTQFTSTNTPFPLTIQQLITNQYTKCVMKNVVLTSSLAGDTIWFLHCFWLQKGYGERNINIEGVTKYKNIRYELTQDIEQVVQIINKAGRIGYLRLHAKTKQHNLTHPKRRVKIRRDTHHRKTPTRLRK